MLALPFPDRLSASSGVLGELRCPKEGLGVDPEWKMTGLTG